MTATRSASGLDPGLRATWLALAEAVRERQIAANMRPRRATTDTMGAYGDDTHERATRISQALAELASEYLDKERFDDAFAAVRTHAYADGSAPPCDYSGLRVRLPNAVPAPGASLAPGGPVADWMDDVAAALGALTHAPATFRRVDYTRPAGITQLRDAQTARNPGIAIHSYVEDRWGWVSIHGTGAGPFFFEGPIAGRIVAHACRPAPNSSYGRLAFHALGSGLSEGTWATLGDVGPGAALRWPAEGDFTPPDEADITPDTAHVTDWRLGFVLDAVAYVPDFTPIDTIIERNS